MRWDYVGKKPGIVRVVVGVGYIDSILLLILLSFLFFLLSILLNFPFRLFFFLFEFLICLLM